MTEQTKETDILDQDDIFLRNAFKNFRERISKNKFWISGYVVFVLIAAHFWLSKQPSFYKATVTILTDPTMLEDAEEKKSLTNLALQEALMRSPEVVDRVIDENDLKNTPLFPKDKNPREVFSELVETELDQGSKSIRVGFYYTDPETAASIANNLAETYIETRAARNSEQSVQAIEKLKEQIKEKSEKLGAIKNRLATLSRENPELEDEAILEEQLKSLNAQIVQTDVRSRSLEATLSEIEVLEQRGEALDSHPYIRNNPMIVEKTKAIRDLEWQVLELQQEYREKHPLVLRAQTKLDILRQSHDEEKLRIVEMLRDEIRVLELSKKKLQENVQELQIKKKEPTPPKLEYRRLQDEEASIVSTIQLLNAQISEASVQASLKKTGIEILNYATPPVRPEKPNKPKVMLLVFIASFFSAAGFLFLLSYLDRTFRSSEDVEDITRKPFLGQVPAIRTVKDGFNPKFADQKEEVFFHNHLRLICANINFVASDNEKKTIMVTGSQPGEGKSFIAYHLAHTFAREGKAAVIIDADFCRSALSSVFPSAGGNRPGLNQFLMEDAAMEQILEETSQPNLYLIRSLEAKFSAPHALRSDRMKNLLNELKNYFDVIVVDAPPVLAVNDAVALGEVVDFRVLVVEWGKTLKDEVVRALSKIASGNLTVSGIILNKTKFSTNSYYYGNREAKKSKPFLK